MYMTKLAKLDTYDYNVTPGIIQIRLNRTNDPILVDIMSDIHNSRNKVYVDGQHFRYNDKYEIVKQGKAVYLELHVTETKSA
jgi:hypothetical protein